MIGQRLGAYEVTAVLGAGGMGEVWRATDTRLGREVALKVLPEDFAADPDRHARFEREAKLLASLNHPNIATLHALEHVEGRHVLVMELVEGEGLDEVIARGPMPVDEAMPIALQIAAALEAAHEAGIVHRDLKPANVRIRPDGTVKVLDFGLAKTWQEEGGDSSLSLSPTVTRHATMEGVILGTAAYMAPEQARGRPVDKRADIWAFGVVLWEMLTGRALFDGETVTDVLAAVLTREPDLAALPAGTPSALRQLLRRCLERNPKNRLHDIADARIAIEDLLAGADELDGPAAGLELPAVPRPNLSAVLWAAAVVLVAGAAGLMGHLAGARRAAPPEPMRLSIVLAPSQELVTGSDSILSFAPDGRSLLMTALEAGRQMIVRRSFGEDDARAIPGTEDGDAAFFSPDGRWIGFFAGGQLLKVPVEGGRPFKLGDSRGAGGAAWLSDGTLVVAPVYSDGLFRVSERGGELERLTTPDRSTGELGHWWPDPLPGKGKVVFTAFRTPVDRSRIGVLDLATREVRWVIEGGFFSRYVAGGHLLYAKGQRLFAVPFDPETATVTGPAVEVVDDLRVSQTSGTAMVAVSSRGTLAYVSESQGNPMRELVWFDRTGREQPAASQQRRFLSVSLSPDGRRAAVTIQQESQDLWTLSLERGTLSRLTSGEGTEFGPVWSSDGSELYYVVDRPPFDLYRIPSDSPDAGRPLWDQPSELDTSDVAVSPDGRWMAFAVTGEQTGFDLWVRPIDGSEPARQFRVSRAEEKNASFSPDGRWLAYQSNENGRPEIYVEAFPGPGQRFQISADGGTEPVWAKGSGEIFYRHLDVLRVVSTRLGGGFEFDPPRTLFPFPVVRGDIEEVRTYDVTADGSRVLGVRIPDALVPRQIEIVTDWQRDLEKRVPGGSR